MASVDRELLDSLVAEKLAWPRPHESVAVGGCTCAACQALRAKIR